MMNQSNDKDQIELDKKEAVQKELVVFFDGHCGLCNGFVDYLLMADQEKKLRFAPLQGELAKNLLSSNYIQNLDTVCFYERGEIHTHSDAVLRIFSHLPSFNKFILVFWLIPRAMRDFCYGLLSKSRYSIFGKSETCRLLNEEESSRFYP
ncbi:thiol-disulfide oxidoreductase DCC family protein [Halobacteriovorax sp. GB3]|uniref:thiol-disulfide oxidoreductase DCC family protein n=1 Tax=Halobacteriovorax sp. GB3 TaxID=2719615 RepID=UPI003FCD25D4